MSTSAATTPRRTCWVTSVRASCGPQSSPPATRHRNYGEFEYEQGKPAGTWQQYYCAAKSVQDGGDPAQLTTPDLKGNYGSVIPSLNKIADPLSPPFDLVLPTSTGKQIWKQDFEKNGPANFNMIWLLERSHRRPG